MACFKEIPDFFTINEIEKFGISSNDIIINGKKFTYNRLLNGGLDIFLRLLRIEINNLILANEKYICEDVFSNVIQVYIFIQRSKCKNLTSSFVDWNLRIVHHIRAYFDINSKYLVEHVHLFMLLSFLYHKVNENEFTAYYMISSWGLACQNNIQNSCDCLTIIISALKYHSSFNKLYKLIDGKSDNYDPLFKFDENTIFDTIIFCESVRSEFDSPFDWTIIDRFISNSDENMFRKALTFIHQISCKHPVTEIQLTMVFERAKIFVNHWPEKVHAIEFSKNLLPSKLLENIKKFKMNDSENKSVFENFICILYTCFAKYPSDEWLKIQRKIITYFDDVLAELNNIGFYHICLYFLSFAELFETSTQYMCNELNARFEKVAFTNTLDLDKMRCVICAYFSMYILLQTRRIDNKHIRAKLKACLTDTFKSYVDKNSSWAQSNSKEIDFIMAYLESLQDALEYIILDPNFFREIFHICFSTILTSENTAFIHRCIFILQKIVNSLKILESSETIFSVLEFIKQLVYSKPGRAFSHELGILTVQSINILYPQYKPKLHDWISRVLFSTYICPNFAITFWQNFIIDKNRLEYLKSSELEIKLVSFWLESLFDCPPQFLKRFLSVISKITDFTKFESKDTEQTTDQMFKSYLYGIRDYEASLTMLDKKILYHNKINEYFKVFRKILDLQITQSVSHRMLLYKTGSSIVEIIPHIVYKKSNTNCIFPIIIDKLILPASKTPSIDENAKEYLASILIGFSRLDFENDQYIRRKLLQIFDRYFIDSLNKSHENVRSSPFLNTLILLSPHDTKLMIFVCEFINIYMGNHFKNCDDHFLCLKFLYNMMKMINEVSNINIFCQLLSIFCLSVLSLGIHNQFADKKDILYEYGQTILPPIDQELENSQKNNINETLQQFFNLYSFRYPKQIADTLMLLTKINKDVFNEMPKLIETLSDIKHPIRSFFKI